MATLKLTFEPVSQHSASRGCDPESSRPGETGAERRPSASRADLCGPLRSRGQSPTPELLQAVACDPVTLFSLRSMAAFRALAASRLAVTAGLAPRPGLWPLLFGGPAPSSRAALHASARARAPGLQW